MKNTLRIVLPRLAEFHSNKRISYAWFDRQGHCTDSGEQLLTVLGNLFHAKRTELVLHPDDVVLAPITVPNVSAKQLPLVVRSGLETVVLGELDALSIGHSSRQDNGTVYVAWTATEPLQSVCYALSQLGLTIAAIIAPQMLALPSMDPIENEPLQLPVDERWRRDAPRWTIAIPQFAVRSPWRALWPWALAAAAIWIVGLNWHARQLTQERRFLTTTIEQQIREAFPSITVLLDPVKQAQQARDQLLNAQGIASSADFLPLALALAQVFPDLQDKIQSLQFSQGRIGIRVHDDATEMLKITPDKTQKALALQLKLDYDATEKRLYVSRINP